MAIFTTRDTHTHYNIDNCLLELCRPSSPSPSRCCCFIDWPCSHLFICPTLYGHYYDCLLIQYLLFDMYVCVCKCCKCTYANSHEAYFQPSLSVSQSLFTVFFLIYIYAKSAHVGQGRQLKLLISNCCLIIMNLFRVAVYCRQKAVE